MRGALNSPHGNSNVLQLLEGQIEVLRRVPMRRWHVIKSYILALNSGLIDRITMFSLYIYGGAKFDRLGPASCLGSLACAVSLLISNVLQSERSRLLRCTARRGKATKMAHFASVLWHWLHRRYYWSKFLRRVWRTQRAAAAALIALFANMSVAVPALATQLYGTSLNTQGADLLVTINPANGDIITSNTVSAGIFGPWPFNTNIAFGPDGTLYGTSLNTQDADLLVTINPANGDIITSNTVSAGIFGPWPFNTNIAFAPQVPTPVPEPGSAALIGVGIFAMLAGSRANARAKRRHHVDGQRGHVSS